MTREEAVEILDGRNIVPMPVYLEALQVAGEALVERRERRDMLDKPDRENWRCPMCEQNKKASRKEA